MFEKADGKSPKARVNKNSLNLFNQKMSYSMKNVVNRLAKVTKNSYHKIGKSPHSKS